MNEFQFLSALASDDADAVARVLDAGRSIDAPLSFGSPGLTPLGVALSEAAARTSLLLIRRGARLAASETDLTLPSLVLSWAVWNVDVFSAMLDTGCQMPATPADISGLLSYAARVGDPGVIPMIAHHMREHGVPITDVALPSLKAAAERRSAPMLRALEQAGVPLDLCDSRGDHALIWACGSAPDQDVRADAEPAVCLLLSRGIGVDTPGEHQETALMRAARYENARTALLLMRLGADFSQRNKYGESALEIAAEEQLHDVLKEALNRGARLTEYGIRGATLLHHAAGPIWPQGAHAFARVAALLIRSGIPIDVRDSGGLTPLLTAAGRGNAEAVGVLAAMGADCDARDRRAWGAGALAENAARRGVIAPESADDVMRVLSAAKARRALASVALGEMLQAADGHRLAYRG